MTASPQEQLSLIGGRNGVDRLSENWQPLHRTTALMFPSSTAFSRLARVSGRTGIHRIVLNSLDL